jgi:DoxX-like family
MQPQAKWALTALQWTLGIVVLIEAILFVTPGARHTFARTHMPDFVRELLGWGEIVGSALLLIPKTALRGAWLLIAVFALEIATHLLHGMWNVGNLAIYISAAWAVAAAK